VIVSRIRRLSRLLPAAALLALGLGPAAAPALAAAHQAPAVTHKTVTHKTVTAAGAETLTGTLPDGATYLIQVPANWNGTLFLYSHGYVVPGSPNPATDVGDPITGAAMLAQGFALAGSSYASTGWAIQQALPDQISTLNIFDSQVGHPKRTIAWGHSLGGIITAGLIQKYPSRFAGALPMCGVLSGGVATWNTALDSEFAFQQLIDPSVQVVNITIPPTDPTANLTAADTAAVAAQATPQGQARLALAAALADTPGWFTPLSPEPAANDYAAQEANQFEWETQVDFPFAFFLRAELEGRAGGNPSWNTGVNYFRDLRRSADFREVRALYKAAGLSLHADLESLNSAARISADPAAVRYLERYITFDGKLPVPVLTMHTIGDGLVVPENEQAYASVVRRAGDSSLLRQIFVSRAGHCAFTPAETVIAAHVLLQRLNTGHWDAGALRPPSLNAAAAALGPTLNVFESGTTLVPTPPAFRAFHPTRYLRPFDR
jgi:pimeloyl-ACP methyl ester carboxylesterase